MLLLGVGTLRILKSEERPAALGLVAVVAGVAGVALAIGVGRGGFDTDRPMGLWSRYAFLTWPLVGLAYLVWVKRGSRNVPMALCLVAALAFTGNMLTGIQVGMQVRETLEDIERDSARGTPPEEIVLRFKGTTQAGQEERAVRAIPMLRAARIGRFAGN